MSKFKFIAEAVSIASFMVSLFLVGITILMSEKLNVQSYHVFFLALTCGIASTLILSLVSIVVARMIENE